MMNLFFLVIMTLQKHLAFNSHNQIAALVYWPSINVQIRMKAKIKKTSRNLIKNIFLIDQKKKMH
jgi:pyridoxine/pyridoxamine 5'-phosphate oxidase